MDELDRTKDIINSVVGTLNEPLLKFNKTFVSQIADIVDNMVLDNSLLAERLNSNINFKAAELLSPCIEKLSSSLVNLATMNKIDFYLDPKLIDDLIDKTEFIEKELIKDQLKTETKEKMNWDRFISVLSIIISIVLYGLGSCSDNQTSDVLIKSQQKTIEIQNKQLEALNQIIEQLDKQTDISD